MGKAGLQIGHVFISALAYKHIHPQALLYCAEMDAGPLKVQWTDSKTSIGSVKKQLFHRGFRDLQRGFVLRAAHGHFASIKGVLD